MKNRVTEWVVAITASLVLIAYVTFCTIYLVNHHQTDTIQIYVHQAP